MFRIKFTIRSTNVFDLFSHEFSSSKNLQDSKVLRGREPVQIRFVTCSLQHVMRYARPIKRNSNGHGTYGHRD